MDKDLAALLICAPICACFIVLSKEFVFINLTMYMGCSLEEKYWLWKNLLINKYMQKHYYHIIKMNLAHNAYNTCAQ